MSHPVRPRRVHPRWTVVVVVAAVLLLAAGCTGQGVATQSASVRQSPGEATPSASVTASAAPTEAPSAGGGLLAFVRASEDAGAETIVRDLASGAETVVATSGYPIALSIDSSTLFVVEPIDPYRDRLLAYPTVGGQPTELAQVFMTYGPASTSPNGRYIVFGSDGAEPNGLVVLDLLTATASQLTTDGGINGAAWSPDSGFIAYEAHGDLFVTPSTGGGSRRLPNDEFYDNPLGWTDDGTSIVELSDRDTDRTKFSGRTWLVNATTGAASLAPGREDDVRPGSRSPDGRWDVVIRNERLEVRPVGGDSLDRSVITRDPGGDLLSWNRDGAWLVYPVAVDGQTDLYLVRVPNGEPIQLTRTDANESHPVWGRAFAADY